MNFEGIINNLERRHKQTKSHYIREWIEKYMSKNDCYSCKGKRLNPSSLAVTIDDIHINDFTKMTTHNKYFL